jgi:hypothetical protein
MKASNIVKESLTLLLIVGIIGCSSDSGNGPAFDPEAELQKAWDAFSQSNYQSAESSASEVLQHDASYSSALVCRGWSRAFQSKFADAESDFKDASMTTDSIDALMGLAVVYRDYPATPNLPACMTYATRLIEADSLYVFDQRTSIDYMDTRLVRAQAAFRRGSSHYASAHEDVNYLCGKLGSPSLPDVSSVTAEVYEQALLSKLEDIAELVN